LISASIFEQKKRAHEAKKKQVVIEVKGRSSSVRRRTSTTYNTRWKHAQEIAKEGNKVKATVRFRRTRDHAQGARRAIA
jgi:translation initiation factor IF-3